MQSGNFREVPVQGPLSNLEKHATNLDNTNVIVTKFPNPGTKITTNGQRPK